MDNDRLLVAFTIYTIVLVNTLLALVLLFAHKPESRTDQRAQRYFFGYFALLAVAHAVYGLKFLSTQTLVISILFTNLLFWIAQYCLYVGFCHRSRTRSIFMKPAVALPVFALMMVVILYLYTSDPDGIKLRMYWTQLYGVVMLVLSLQVVRSRQAEFHAGDRLTRLSLYAAIGLTLGGVIATALMDTRDIGHLIVLSTTIIAESVLILGGLHSSFLHDAVVLHYRNSVTDSMTGLYNRRHLIDEARRLVSLSILHQFPVSIVMCDIDKFKNINDTYGHDIGDEVIKAFARILQSCVRTEDILARWGGEEFVVLLAKTNVDQAQVLVERMRENTSRFNFDTGNNTLGFTASFGVAFVEEGLDLEAGIKCADEALYHAKEGGRNRVEVYSIG